MFSILLWLRFAFDEVLHAQRVAIKYSIGAELNPVAQNEQSGLARKHEVEFDMTMPIDEVIDVGVRLEIFLGVDDERLLVFTLISRCPLLLVFQPAMLGPFKAELQAPAGGYTGKQPLQHGIVKHAAQESELAVGVTQPIAMSQIEEFALDIYSHRFIMHDDTTLLGEILLAPEVVVTDEKVHLYTMVGEFAHLAQEAGKPLRHHVAVFEPEVEYVAQHIHGRSLVLYRIEEIDQTAFTHTHRGECAAAQVCVGDEINHDY